jgi:hypothetical protein
MPSYNGYLRHEIVRDLGDPGHLLVMSCWAGSEHVDPLLHEQRRPVASRDLRRAGDRQRALVHP